MSDSDTTTPARRTYRFPPHGSGGWILGMTIPQLCAVTAAGFAAVDALRTLPAPAGPVLAAALAIVAYLAIFLPYAGHTTLEWVPVIARFMFATATSTRTWRTRAATMGHEVELSAGDGTARFEPRPVRAPVSLPPELKRVEILEARLGRSVPLGVVHDKAAGTYAATIRCEPRAFALLGEENRETLLSGYGGLLASFAQDSSPVRRIAWYERTLPASAGELQAYAREHVRPDIQPDDVGLQGMRQLLAHHRGGQGDHEMLVSVQVDARRPAAARSIKQLGGGRDGALALIGEQAVKLAGELGRIGVLGAPAAVGGRQASVPSARALAGVIRNALDPHTRLERERTPARPESDEPGIPAESVGPRARDVHWSYVRADGSLHATGHLLEWPRQDVRATFLEPLLMRSAETRTVAMVMEVLGPRKATRRAERASEEATANSWLRRRVGRRTTERDRVREGAVGGAERELAVGHALVRFSGYVTVSVPEEAGVTELDAAFERVQGIALASGLRLERMHGEQMEALTFTIPGLCRGLI